MPQLRLERGRPVGAIEMAPPRDIEEGGPTAYARLKPGPGRPAAEVASHQRARINRAMVEVVAERGYRGATVREIAGIAGISTRAFYQHYSDKEECFLQAHRLLARRLHRRAEETDVHHGSMRFAATVGAIIEEWGSDPHLARFFLIAPHDAGPAALRQSRLVDRSLAARLATGFAAGSGREGAQLPVLISAGVLAGLGSVARTRILKGRGAGLLALREDLELWASSYQSCSLAELEALEAAGALSQGGDESLHSNSSSKLEREGRAASSLSGDAALLHSGVARLAARGDRDKLTVHEICAAAGVPRTCFEAHFTSLKDCLATVEEQHALAALDQASWVAQRSSAGPARAQRGLASLCDQVARDPALANLCFGELVASGEWLAQRERRLVGDLCKTFDLTSLADRSKERPVAVEASFGAVLGSIRREVGAGLAGPLRRLAPVFGYLMLAPFIGASEAIGLACGKSRPADRARAS